MADPLPDYPHTPLPFAEAIAWANARRVVLPEVYYGPLQGLARSMAFSVAGLTKLSQLELVMKSLEAATADGQSFAAWKKRVEGGEINLDLPAYRVENIFRTNIQSHYARGRCEQQKRNVENRPWFLYDAVNDSRTRPSHAAMDGFVARYDDPIWQQWSPPCGYNSFLPGQQIRGDFNLGLKVRYSGPAVEIVTKRGKRLSLTINHPVVTDKGLVRAGELHEGANLLGYIPENISAFDDNNKQAPSVVEEVFDALATQGRRVFPGSRFYLHGDQLFFEGDVEAVGATPILHRLAIEDPQLKSRHHACSDDLVHRGDFNIRNAAFPPSAPTLVLNSFSVEKTPFDFFGFASTSPFNPGFIKSTAQRIAAYSNAIRKRFHACACAIFGNKQVKVGNVDPTFFDRATAPDRTRILRRSAHNLVLAQDPTEAAIADPGLFQNINDRNAGKVICDQVVSVRHFTFSGHIYDFETKHGLVILDDIIVTQCRCRRIALTEKQAERFRGADERRMQRDTEDLDARMIAITGGPDDGWDYDICSEPTEGLRRAIERRQQSAEAIGVAIPAPDSILTAIDEARENVRAFGAETGRERLVLFDEATGVILHQADGTTNSVTFSDDAVALLADASRQLMLIHNHPGDGSLSTADLASATLPGASGIEAVGAHGSFYSGRALIADRDEMSSSLQAIGRAVRQVFQASLNAGDIGIPSAEALHHHAINTAADRAELILYHAVLNTEKQAMIDEPNMLETFEKAVDNAVKALQARK